jgi:hypothetical protein
VRQLVPGYNKRLNFDQNDAMIRHSNSRKKIEAKSMQTDLSFPLTDRGRSRLSRTKSREAVRSARDNIFSPNYLTSKAVTQPASTLVDI